MAVGDRDASNVTFIVEQQGANSHLSEVSMDHALSRQVDELKVRLTSLDSYFEGQSRSPDVIKIDVEGAEALVLRGMTDILSRGRLSIILSTHSADLKKECWFILKEAGYHVSSLPNFEHEIIAERNDAK